MRFNLAAWRNWCGLSQAELAALSGVTATAIGQIERSEHPAGYLTVQALARAFGVPRSVLLHSTPEQEWQHGWRPPEHDARLAAADEKQTV